MIVQNSNIKIVIFNKKEELDVVWGDLIYTKEIKELIKTKLSLLSKEAEKILKTAGFKEPVVNYDLKDYLFVEASFIADEFKIIPNYKIEVNHAHLDILQTAINDLYDSIYESATAYYIEKEIREYTVNCNSVEWDTDDEVNYNDRINLQSSLFNVERALEKSFNQFVIEVKSGKDWFKESLISANFKFKMDEIEVKKLVDKINKNTN